MVDGGEYAVAAVLDDRAARYGERTVLRIDGVDIGFAQLRDRSVAAANVLRGLGIGAGDTVALFSGSTPEWVYFWLGAARIGATTAAVNAANKGESLRHALTLSRSRVVVADTPERAERVREVAGGLSLLVSADDLLAGVPTVDTTPCPPADPDAVGAVFFTSGTTGPSKAVACSWRYLCTAAETIAAAWEFSAGETIWSAMPLFHLSAVATVLAPVLVGGTTVLASSFSPAAVWEGVRGSGAIGFVGAGAMVSMLLRLPADDRDAASGLRFISAAPIAAEHYRAIERRYGCRVVTMYGLTEAFPIAVKAVGENGVPGTSGRVHPDFETSLVDGELTCRPSRPGVMSLGYLHADGLVPHDVWFRTGDLATVDDDGELTYVDRVKDAIRRRGENVSSVEVENVVTAFPGVAEAAVVGVASELGEQDVLVVLAVLPDADVDPRALLDFCADRMPYFCVPRYLKTVAALPRNAVGRVRKDLLRADGLGADVWDREAVGYVVKR
jgi:crotonobetaine/carnitine-CoA ligase